TFQLQPLERNSGGLAVYPSIDLRAPDARRGIGLRQVSPRSLELSRHHQVALDVAGQVLDHALRFRVRSLTEIRLEPIEGGEAYVLGMRHDHVGYHACLQARHAVTQHYCWYTIQL